MREIKFRGRRIDTREWAYGWYVGCSEAMGYICGDYIDNDEVWQVRADTVGQYTGLKDKNGTEIFEGDIIKHHGDITSRVFYNSAHCAFMLDDITGNRNKCQVDHLGSYSSLWIEVIGNIYDNPELLGGAE